MVCVGRSIDDLLANPKEETNRQYSVEFCGGTHLGNTAEAGAFALISEEGEKKGGKGEGVRLGSAKVYIPTVILT